MWLFPLPPYSDRSGQTLLWLCVVITQAAVASQPRVQLESLISFIAPYIQQCFSDRLPTDDATMFFCTSATHRDFGIAAAFEDCSQFPTGLLLDSAFIEFCTIGVLFQLAT